MRTIPTNERERAFNLRCRSKKGEYISVENILFLEIIYKNYPEDCETMEKEVFEATKPFGA